MKSEGVGEREREREGEREHERGREKIFDVVRIPWGCLQTTVIMSGPKLTGTAFTFP